MTQRRRKIIVIFREINHKIRIVGFALTIFVPCDSPYVSQHIRLQLRKDLLNLHTNPAMRGASEED